MWFNNPNGAAAAAADPSYPSQPEDLLDLLHRSMYGHQTALENLNATTGQHSQALEELGSVVIRQAKLSDFETEASTKAMLALQAAMQVEIQKRTHAQNLAIASFAASGVVLILGALSSFLLSSKVDAINGKNSSNQTVIYRNPVRPIAR